MIRREQAAEADDRDPLQYDLPQELIAQHPAPERDRSRLMILDRAGGAVNHGRFSDLGQWLPTGALLVANDSKVVPARIRGRKLGTGGFVEALLLGTADGEATRVAALTRSSKGVRPGHRIEFGEGIEAVVLGPVEEGRCALEFSPWTAAEVARRIGELPLPPYICRPAGPTVEDVVRYQTVYARRPGSVAAPTAGLHFTPELIESLKVQGFEFTNVTLHVGPGTFAPVRAGLDEHRMEGEEFEIGEEAAERISSARRQGRPVVAVGTTTVRALESAALGQRGSQATLTPGRGVASLFIRPGHRFEIVDALVTNFHLPGSTLLALVMALAGPRLIRSAYRMAVEEHYRFYSFGDAMLIR